jgi:hypothetical protein
MRTTIATLLVLVSVSVAHAECAWVLWQKEVLHGGGDPTWWDRLDFCGTEAECRRKAIDAASLRYASEYARWPKRGTLPEPRRDDDTTVSVFPEFESRTFSYVCLRDTVDPRGLKGTK